MGTVYGFNHERDVNRVLSMLDKFESSKGKSVISPSSIRQEARYAKIVTLIGEGDNAGKEATGVEVIWNKVLFDFTEVSEAKNPVLYDDELLKGDDATVFSTNNIVSKTKMAVDDIVLLQKYPGITETGGWLVVETGGGGGGRQYVVITAADNASTYTGDTVKSPSDPTVVKAGVTISAFGATGAPLAVDTTYWADYSAVDDVYYISVILAR